VPREKSFLNMCFSHFQLKLDFISEKIKVKHKSTYLKISSAIQKLIDHPTGPRKKVKIRLPNSQATRRYKPVVTNLSRFCQFFDSILEKFGGKNLYAKTCRKYGKSWQNVSVRNRISFEAA